MLVQYLSSLFDTGIALHLGFSALEISGGHRERSLQRQIDLAIDDPHDDAELVRRAFRQARRRLTVLQGQMIRIALFWAVIDAVGLVATCLFAEEKVETIWLPVVVLTTLIPLPAMVIFLFVMQGRMFDEVHRQLRARGDAIRSGS